MSTPNKSNQIKAVLREGFKDGTSKLADRKCYGFSQTPDGLLTIIPKEAEVVVWIFESYLMVAVLGKLRKIWKQNKYPLLLVK